VRAVLEGVAYHYRGAIEIVRELGVEVRRISMTGGEVRSDLWNVIKASVLGAEIILPRVADAASLGAAILAAVGAKCYDSFHKAIQSMVHVERKVEPDPRLKAEYDRLYPKYVAVYRCLEKAFEELDLG